MIEIVESFVFHNFFQNIGRVFSAVLAFYGEEIIVSYYSTNRFRSIWFWLLKYYRELIFCLNV